MHDSDNYSAIDISLLPSNNDRMALMVFNCDCWLLHAVSEMECSAKKTLASPSDVNVPEIFYLIFSFLIPLSLALLSDGILGFSRKLNM